MIITNFHSPSISKMWSAFSDHSKLPDIYEEISNVACLSVN